MIRMIHGVLVAFGAWACLSFAPESMNEENSPNLSWAKQQRWSIFKSFMQKKIPCCRVTSSPGAPLASSAASTISHLLWFPVAIWPRSCVLAAWSPTPRCLVVCDRSHQNVDRMVLSSRRHSRSAGLSWKFEILVGWDTRWMKYINLAFIRDADIISSRSNSSWATKKRSQDLHLQPFSRSKGMVRISWDARYSDSWL